MTGQCMETCPIQHWFGEPALRFTLSVVPAQQFGRQCYELDVELIFLHSINAVFFKSAFPLPSVIHNHSHTWWREEVMPPRVSAYCSWPSDLGLLLIYCHYLQPCKERGLKCVSLFLDLKLHSDGDEFVCRKPKSIPTSLKNLSLYFQNLLRTRTYKDMAKGQLSCYSLFFSSSVMQV